MSSFGNRFKFSPTRYEELDGETSLMTSEEQVPIYSSFTDSSLNTDSSSRLYSRRRRINPFLSRRPMPLFFSRVYSPLSFSLSLVTVVDDDDINV